MRYIGWWCRVAVAGLLLACSLSAAARPYTIEDMLRTEAFGRILPSPDGRWLVFERRVALADAAFFDFNAMDVVRSRLYRVGLRHPGPAQPLVALAPGIATLAYGFSPHGTRIAIARFDGQRWQLGVVTLASGAVRWFDISPDYAPFRTTLGWLSEDRLVAIAQPDTLLPWLLRMDLQDAHDLPLLWAQARAGQTPTVTAIGSGDALALTPPAAPTRLVALDVTTGTRHVLAEGELQSLRVSPDGRHVALVEQGATIRIDSAGPIREATDLRRRTLRIVDADDGRVWTPCLPCDVPFAPPVWSPGGGSLLFFARRAGQDWPAGVPWRADLASGGRATPLALGRLRPAIIAQTGAYDAVGLGWLGTTPLLFARDAGRRGDRADWVALDGQRVLTAAVDAPSARLVADGSGRPLMLAQGTAWRLGPSGARPILDGMTGFKPIPAAARAAGGEGEMTLLGWRVRDGTMHLATADGQRARIARTDPADRPEALAAGGGVIATRTSASGASSLILARPGEAPRTLAAINRHLDAVAAPVAVALRHRLPDGSDATSWLYLPASTPGTARPQLIVIPYAGRSYGATAPALAEPAAGRSYTNVSALVGHGYAVLLPSMPQLAASDRPFAFAAQVMTAVDAAIARGLVDPDRLGLWGHSYGGFTAATVATQTDRFKAIVVADGIYDLASFQGVFAPSERRNPGYGQGIIPWAGWAESEQPRLGAPPWARPLRSVANSPYYQAGNITTPILIIAADRDFAPLQQGEQLFSALYRQGKDAELLSYWGEGHALVSPANIRDCYARIFAWFDRHFGEAMPGVR